MSDATVSLDGNDNKATKEQIMERYGDLTLKFSSYYKYSFSFSAMAPDGVKVMASIGGDSNEIYRYEVTPDSTTTLLANDWKFAHVVYNGKELWSEYKW